MFKNILIALFALLIVAGCQTPTKPTFAKGDKIKIYYVHRDGCPACSYMDEVLKDKEIQSIIKANFNLITVDYRAQNSTLPKKSMITFKTPTLYFLDSSNKEIRSPIHALDKIEFKKLLNSLKKN